MMRNFTLKGSVHCCIRWTMNKFAFGSNRSIVFIRSIPPRLKVMGVMGSFASKLSRGVLNLLK